jgi:hypothetical protein
MAVTPRAPRHASRRPATAPAFAADGVAGDLARRFREATAVLGHVQGLRPLRGGSAALDEALRAAVRGWQATGEEQLLPLRSGLGALEQDDDHQGAVVSELDEGGSVVAVVVFGQLWD